MADERPQLTRSDVIALRRRAHGLDASPGSVAATDVAVLDLGIQDTGADGALWALANRGADVPDGPEAAARWEGLALAWTLRAAPHAYRRADLDVVAVATSPFSADDAAKRIYDAAKPLRQAGIDVLGSLASVAHLERDVVREPTVKGELSSALTPRLDPAQVRWCGPCQAEHSWEMPFRLATLQAGLELEPGTSPPVLRRAPGMRPAYFGATAADASPRLDVVRGYLRFFGPATVKDVAAYLDAPPRDVLAHWPDDAVEVDVVDLPAASTRGAPDARWLLADDAAQGAVRTPDSTVRLLGPYDPWVQLRDRPTLVPDESRRKELWRTLGRPGAVYRDGQVVGTWRPRASGKKLTVLVDPWVPLDRATSTAIEAEAERLARFRGVTFAGVTGLADGR